MSGKVPVKDRNVSPRIGLAYSIGQDRPLVIRAGYGLFYTRIPQIYTSTIATDNGMTSANLFLDNTNYYEHQVFPAYPGPLATCAMKSTFCAPPSTVSSYLSSDVASFAPNFVTPRVHQASLNLEREIANRFAGGVSYMYVHGQNLIRARDVNLPTPTDVTYPVYDESGVNFLGAYYDVPSFSTWQMTRSMTCPFPPCINPLARPISQLGAINQFDSAASSVYQGLTVSLHRRMTSGLYFRMAYTFAHAYDDGQDALVAGRPGHRAELVCDILRARPKRHRPAASLRAVSDRATHSVRARSRLAFEDLQRLEDCRCSHYRKRPPRRRKSLRRSEPGWKQLQRSTSGLWPQCISRSRLCDHRPATYSTSVLAAALETRVSR